MITLEKEEYPEMGSPQGGVISPLLANLVLSGLEQHIKSQFKKTYKTPSGKRAECKINVVRYADDFIVTCANKEAAFKVIRLVEDFLAIRGLKLNLNKTKITKVKDGFDFLGFKYKLYDKGLLVTPSPNSVKRMRKRIKEAFRINLNNPMGKTIMDVNSILRG